jgi:hypothetical protein
MSQKDKNRNADFADFFGDGAQRNFTASNRWLSGVEASSLRAEMQIRHFYDGLRVGLLSFDVVPRRKVLRLYWTAVYGCYLLI